MTSEICAKGCGMKIGNYYCGKPFALMGCKLTVIYCEECSTNQNKLGGGGVPL